MSSCGEKNIHISLSNDIYIRSMITFYFDKSLKIQISNRRRVDLIFSENTEILHSEIFLQNLYENFKLAFCNNRQVWAILRLLRVFFADFILPVIVNLFFSSQIRIFFWCVTWLLTIYIIIFFSSFFFQ